MVFRSLVFWKYAFSNINTDYFDWSFKICFHRLQLLFFLLCFLFYWVKFYSFKRVLCTCAVIIFLGRCGSGYSSPKHSTTWCLGTWRPLWAKSWSSVRKKNKVRKFNQKKMRCNKHKTQYVLSHDMFRFQVTKKDIKIPFLLTWHFP